jgi:hypothetical protein
MTEQMVARGQMPALAALMAGGAVAPLRSEPEQVPAIVWTTVATGRGPEAHGIRSAGARRLAGMRTPVPLGEAGAFSRALGTAADLVRISRSQPATAVLREVKAFWNVAAEKGLKVGVVNWWATWPADPVPGFLVTDRALFKLESGGPPDREVHPAAAFERLRGVVPPAQEDRARRLDRFAIEASRLLAREAPPDVEAVYLPGLDITTLRDLGDAAIGDVAGLDERLAAVRSYYQFVDGLVAAFAEEGSGPAVLAIVGDPGRLARRAPTPAEGLLVLSGPAIAPGSLPPASERDVAPTVLHLAGLPASRELDGHVLEAALSPAFKTAHPLRWVDSYGRRPAARAAESRFDRDVLEQLRSLGYIQ